MRGFLERLLAPRGEGSTLIGVEEEEEEDVEVDDDIPLIVKGDPDGQH